MTTVSIRETRTRVDSSSWGYRSVLLSGVVLAAVLLTAGPFGALRADAAVPVLLGTAGNFAVLGGTADVTNTGPSVLTGDLGVSPALSLVGFTGPPDGTVIGAQHPGDAVADQAQLDLTTAYNQAAGMASLVVPTELGGTAPVPGAYTDGPGGGGLDLNGTITLDGGGSYDAVWVFQSTSDLITAGVVSLTNGAQACNVFWQVTSSASLGTGTVLAGTVMALTSITVVSGVTVQGRLLARNGTVTLDNDVITRPATCLTGSVAGGTGGTGGTGGSGAGGLALSGTDATPGLIWAASLIAVGFGAVALGWRLNPRGRHRAN